MRLDTRQSNQLRSIQIIPNYIPTTGGSVLIQWGNTRVICTAMMEESVPAFRRESQLGWLSAEYAMLPGSTPTRRHRETIKPDGRSTEIKRLIGRSLRAALDFTKVKGSIWIDCDVIQADGGTRTASITGSWVALRLACDKWLREGLLDEDPIVCQVAAVSVGIWQGQPVLDLPYAEDSCADVDMNIVKTGLGEYIEVQGTGEGCGFSRDQMDCLLDYADSGLDHIFALQREAVQKTNTLVIASNNQHKTAEIKEILGNRFPCIINMNELGLDLDIPETGNTFEENALIKATMISNITGYAAIADDSGLMVDALDGAPGVYSARYAGVHGDDEANNDKLLQEMAEVGQENRSCRYVCAIAIAYPGGSVVTGRGTCEGQVLYQRQGTGGFGYDPLVFLPDQGKTMAELTPEEKNSISHRYHALMDVLRRI